MGTLFSKQTLLMLYQKSMYNKSNMSTFMCQEMSYDGANVSNTVYPRSKALGYETERR